MSSLSRFTAMFCSQIFPFLKRLLRDDSGRCFTRYILNIRPSFLAKMNLVDEYPDLPSPTNRDSAASAIFNLYGYQNRDSMQAEEKGEVSRNDMMNGTGYRYTGGFGEGAEDGLVEELQSPHIAEPQPQAEQADFSPAGSRTSANDVFTIGGNGTSSTKSRPKSMALAPSLPASSQVSSRRHSSAVSTEPLEDAPNRITHPSREGLPRSTITEEEQSAFLSVPSDTQQRALNQESPLTGRQPGEEEDAYHVRSTCEYPSSDPNRRLKYDFSDARLEVQGVYGDGWDEGIERTRGRAIKDDRRSSQVLPSKSETLPEQEREALGKVDRYVTAEILSVREY